MYIKNQYITYHYHKPYPLRDAADSSLMDILDVKRVGFIKDLQAEAIEEVIRRYSKQPFAERPLRAGCSLALFGKTHFKQRDLQQRLKALGIQWHKQLLPTTTHVLLGWKINALRPLRKKILLSERDLQQFLDEAEQPYLRNENQNEAALAHLEQLLLSPEEENQQLAVALIQGGGFSEHLITPTFVASKTASSKTYRAFLRNTLSRYLSPAACERAHKNYHLTGVPELKIEQNIKKYTKNQVELDGVAIAQCLYQSQGVGFQYLWKHLKDQDTVKALLRQQVVGNLLDLKGRNISMLPSVVGDLVDLKGMDLARNWELSRLPAGVARLQQLEHLDLTYTDVSDVRVLQALPNLRILRLVHPFAYHARGLDGLKQLDELHLLHEPYAPFQKTIQALEECLPQTKFVWH